jgi:hypothetical protein
MKKFIALVLLASAVLQAIEWDFTKEVALSKDQYQTVLVRDEQELRVLKFRWTLFAGGGLVMHLNYNGRSSQFILYKQYKKNSYKIEILPKLSAYKMAPVLYLQFKKFDHKTKKAYFDILIDDSEKRALIEVKPLKESL